jgi:hypothetical protein
VACKPRSSAKLQKGQETEELFEKFGVQHFPRPVSLILAAGCFSGALQLLEIDSKSAQSASFADSRIFGPRQF